MLKTEPCSTPPQQPDKSPSSHSSCTPVMPEAPRFNYNFQGEKGRRPSWAPHEDKILRSLVAKYGTRSWGLIAKELNACLPDMLAPRNGKSCRSRWMHQLSPEVKKTPFTEEEEVVIVEMQNALGNKWAQISRYLPGRTDNAVKNHWNGHLKRKVRPWLVKKVPEKKKPLTAGQAYWEPTPHDIHNLPIGGMYQPGGHIPMVGNQVFMPFFNNKMSNHQPILAQDWSVDKYGQMPSITGDPVQGNYGNKNYLKNAVSPSTAIRALATGAITQALMDNNSIFNPMIAAKLGVLVGGLTILEQPVAKDAPEVGAAANTTDGMFGTACDDVQNLDPPDGSQPAEFCGEPGVKSEYCVCP